MNTNALEVGRCLLPTSAEVLSTENLYREHSRRRTNHDKKLGRGPDRKASCRFWSTSLAVTSFTEGHTEGGLRSQAARRAAADNIYFSTRLTCIRALYKMHKIRFYELEIHLYYRFPTKSASIFRTVFLTDMHIRCIISA